MTVTGKVQKYVLREPRDRGARPRGRRRREDRVRRLLAIAAAALLLPAAPAWGKKLGLVKLGTFASPTHVARPPGDRTRLFVVEQAGRIMVLDHGHKLKTPFLDIRSKVKFEGERGLLSMAFDPHYKTNGRFYVDYVDMNGNSNIVAYRRSSKHRNRANPAIRRRVLFQRQPEPNHNGGLLLFGPDGKLYVGVGTAAGGGGADATPRTPTCCSARSCASTPTGKAARATRIPADNPFAGPGDPARRDLGLRAAQPVALLVRPRHRRRW